MTLRLVPAWAGPAAPFRHTFAPIGNVDQFRWLVRADQREQLRMARDELGVRHVRACAMYSPEMRVWGNQLVEWNKPAAERGKAANWQVVDYALEGLMELGLKPIYTPCFVPDDFTDGVNRCWPDGNNTAPPRDLGRWAEFVTGGIRHHIERYGLDEVRTWYFECWNEPNLGCFFGGTKEQFFALWSATWRAVKAAHPDLRFGGPSTARGEWIPEFLDHAAADGTMPDYLISHVYNNDSEAQPLSPFDGPASHRVKDSPHFATGVVRGVRRTLDARGFRGEVHWNEWGRSWFPHDPLKESPLEAAFIAKTMGEVSQEADAFAFWSLSDIYDQAGYQSAEFQGHYGMLSLHGLRKPAWWAHVMLHRLGTSRVAVAGGDALENAVATPTIGGGSVLVWRHPETARAEGPARPVEVELPAHHRGGARLLRLGASENSSVARWRAMGAPAYPTPRQIAELRAQDRLEPATDLRLVREGGRLLARFPLESPGVALLEMTAG